MNFGTKIRYVRFKLQLTQEELANKAGIPLSTIIKWENEPDTKPQLANYGKFVEFCEKNNIDLNEAKEIY